MKDQYVGDVNDYLKYAFLRRLSENLTLGVIWMLTPSDTRTDGQRLAYLDQPQRFRHIDPYSFDALREVVRLGRRSVRAIEAAELLSKATFFSEFLYDDRHSRDTYISRALTNVAGSEIVFFDPDNGFGTRSVEIGQRGSSKYVFLNEVTSAFQLGHSLVVYQHFPRRPREAFLQDLAGQVTASTSVPACLAVATGHVAFLVIPQPHHLEVMRNGAYEFGKVASPHARFVDLSLP